MVISIFMKHIPKSLRIWFIIHFIVDIIFALPLMIAPEWFLGLLGFITVDPVASRLVGAALIGIGGASLLVRNKGLESFNSLLTLKILWSVSAIIGIIWSLIEGAPLVMRLVLPVFAIFSAVWIYYKIRLSK